jgi:hypothetical protein
MCFVYYVGISELIKVVDCTGMVKDARYMAAFVIEYIISLGEGGGARKYETRQVLMDNAC